MSSLTGRIPIDPNRRAVTAGVSSSDGTTPTPLEVNPVTGRLLVDAGATTTQYTQGGATVANPTGTADIWFDASGNPKAVTPSQPLPSNITNGTTVAQVDTNGNLDTTLGTKLDPVNDAITTYPLGHSYTNITTNATTTVKSGAGVLMGIIVNNPALITVTNLTLTIYDNTAGSGTKIGTITVPFGLTTQVPFKIPYALAFTTGLTIVTAGPTAAADLTVEWR